MALSGTLGFVPLDEVLRLLMRADRRGSVEVRGEDIRGRIFVGNRGIGLATTAEDRDVHTHLVNSGYVDDAFLRKVVSGESSFSDLGEGESSLVGLLREMTIESLYQLSDKGASFEVAENATSPYSSPKPFELEAALDDALRRSEEWASVRQVIADLDSTIRMNRDPVGGEEIKINREAWRLLCELGSGASVKVMAERLGTTEFWIARVAAEMSEQQLLVLADATFAEAKAETPQATMVGDVDEDVDPHESWWIEPEEPSPETSEEGAEDTTEPVPQPGVEAAAGGEPAKDSRFGHFSRADRSDEAFAPAAESAQPASEPEEYQEEDHQGAWAFEPASEAEGAEEVEEDTEAFLEKVFSELDSNGQVDVEEEGHGLLRRRRMGSVLKEIDED